MAIADTFAHNLEGALPLPLEYEGWRSTPWRWRGKSYPYDEDRRDVIHRLCGLRAADGSLATYELIDLAWVTRQLL